MCSISETSLNEIKDFEKMCERHDLTFQMSDSGATFKRGSEQLAKIFAKAKLIGEETAERIWNEIVDSKMTEDSREMFYWK